MTGTRDKVEAIIDWSWDRFSKTGGPHVLDRGDAAEINWDDDPTVTASGSGGLDLDRRLTTEPIRNDQRPGSLAVRDHDHLPLLLRPGHDRPGVPGRDSPDDLVPHRQPGLQAADAFLRHAAADQRRDRRGHRTGSGVPIRDELVDVLALCRRRVRSTPGDGGHPRVLPRIDVPRTVAVRLGPVTQARSPGLHLGGVRGDDAVGDVHLDRELVDAASGRLQDRQTGPSGADQCMGSVRKPDVRVGVRARPAGVVGHRLPGDARGVRVVPAQG